ncbi:MAG TPA: hypothetical protein VH372_04835 [Actinospica sp.]|nr:hypothetical protein [Actinospica sp.]
MTQELADADEARESVFEFRTELLRGDAAEPEEGPRLRVFLESDGRLVPSRLAWTAIDGAHTAIAFRDGMAEFTGVHRGADGSPAQFQGRLASRRAYPSLPSGVQAADVLTFDTQEEEDPEQPQSGWRRAGRVRLLLDDGRGCALRDMQWQDARGLAAAISFKPDRSGFLGYLTRPGQEPVAVRGFAVPARTVPTGDELVKELEDFGREALGIVNDVVGRLAGWLGGGGGDSGNGGGPRPA